MILFNVPSFVVNPSVIERPRLLVLSGGIEYQRGDKFTNLEQLSESEERRIEVGTRVCRTPAFTICP